MLFITAWIFTPWQEGIMVPGTWCLAGPGRFFYGSSDADCPPPPPVLQLWCGEEDQLDHFCSSLCASRTGRSMPAWKPYFISHTALQEMGNDPSGIGVSLFPRRDAPGRRQQSDGELSVPFSPFVLPGLNNRNHKRTLFPCMPLILSWCVSYVMLFLEGIRQVALLCAGPDCLHLNYEPVLWILFKMELNLPLIWFWLSRQEDQFRSC